MVHRRRSQEGRRIDEYRSLAACVSGYEVRIEARLTTTLKMADPRRAVPTDPLYSYVTVLDIEALCTDPDDRAGEVYNLTIVGDPSAEDLRMTLGDVRAWDDQHQPRYRQYRGEEVAVYEPPPGIAVFSRAGGRGRWLTYLPVPPQIASDMLTSLATGAAQFLAIHEHRVERKRWIDSVALQSSDPMEE